MSKRYKIAMLVDAAEALRPVNRVSAALRKMEADALAALNRIQQAAAAATNAAAGAAGSGAGSGGSGGGRGRVRGAKLTLEEIAALEDAYVRRDYQRRIAHERRKAQLAERQAADSARSIEATEDAHLRRDYQQRVAHERRKAREADREAARMQGLSGRLYTQEEARLRALGEARRRQNDRMVADELKLMGITGRRFKNGADGADKLIGSVKNLAMSYVGLQAGVNIIKGLGEAAREAAESQDRMTTAFIAYRDSLREQQDMQGKPITTRDMIANAEFEAETGMKADEAKSFKTAFLGSGAQYEGKNLSNEQFAQYQKGAANLAVTTAIEPAIMGEMAGTIAGSRDYQKENGKDAGRMALRDLNQMVAVLQRGRGDNATMARQASMLSSFAMNPDELLGTFQNPKELATAASVAAEVNPGEAEVFVRNAIKAIRPVGDGANEEKQRELMKRSGVTPQTKFFDAYKLIAPVVMAEAKDKKLDLMQVLGGYGYDQREAKAMGAFINKGVAGGGFEDRFAVADQNAAPEVVEKKIRDAQMNPEGAIIHRKAEAGVRLAEMKRGSEAPGVKDLELQAQKRMIAAREETTSWKDRAYDMSFGAIEHLEGGMWSAEQRKTKRMQEILKERAISQGVNLPRGQPTEDGAVFGGVSSAKARDTYFNKAINAFSAQGGNALVDLTKAQLVELRKLNAANAPKPGPMPLGARAGAGMQR